MSNLSVVLATFNEEANIGACLDSVKDLADEIIVMDGSSTDKTVDIAKKYGAFVQVTQNHKIFHINKQKAIDKAKYEWVLQLDADERVSPELAHEIRNLMRMTEEEIITYQEKLTDNELFLRHSNLIQKRDGTIGLQEGYYAAFFIPRLNYFLGKYLRYGGVYPDGVIRLIKKGKAYLPCKNVHEQMVVDGKVGWLSKNLHHYDSPTFARYITRWKRYCYLIAGELEEKKTGCNPVTGMKHILILPIWWFLLTYVRHKGFLDSWQGLVFSFFSSLRFPYSYIIYLKNRRNL